MTALGLTAFVSGTLCQLHTEDSYGLWRMLDATQGYDFSRDSDLS
jgi:hypothetical protein